jgi:hypothetical protein
MVDVFGLGAVPFLKYMLECQSARLEQPVQWLGQGKNPDPGHTKMYKSVPMEQKLYCHIFTS